jgi:hypothetical protein
MRLSHFFVPQARRHPSATCGREQEQMPNPAGARKSAPLRGMVLIEN